MTDPVIECTFTMRPLQPDGRSPLRFPPALLSMPPTDSHAQSGAHLLAVDAGLRAGVSLWSPEGRLLRYRSTNFGAPKRLRRGVHTVLRDLPSLTVLVVEGGGTVADPWLREGQRRGLRVHQVQAGVWRDRLLLPRQRRTGKAAKEQADVLARQVIEWSDAPRPTSLRHDAAEAILIGLWAVLEAGWLKDPPPLSGAP